MSEDEFAVDIGPSKETQFLLCVECRQKTTVDKHC